MNLVIIDYGSGNLRSVENAFKISINNNNLNLFYNEIKNMYKVSFIKNVDLFTVRHFTENSLEGIYKLGTSLVSQINKNTAQIIIQKNN